MRPSSGLLPFLLAGFAALCPAVSIHATPSPPPEERSARANQVLASWSGGPGAPGCSAAVALNDQVVWSGASGEADLEHGVPIGPATVFDSGSVAKPVTAIAALLLERDGKLSLDDPIRKHLPDLSPAYEPVRVRHLLTHTSGIREWQDLLFSMSGVRRDDEMRNGDVVRVLRAQRGLNFPPGTHVRYTNSEYVLLGQIVQQVSGASLPEFARTRIFEPLEMGDSRLVDDHTALIRGIADGHQEPTPGAWELVPRTSDLIGSSHLYTTPADLLKLVRAATRPDWKDVFARLQRPGVLAGGLPAQDDAGHVAGHGFWLQTHAGQTLAGHTGVTNGTRAAVYRVAETGDAVALLCNRNGFEPDQPALELLDVFTQGEWAATLDTSPPDSPQIERPAAELTRFAGVYQQPMTRIVQRFAADDNALYLGRPGERRVLPLADGRNAIADAPGFRVQFEMTDGKAHMKLWNLGAREPEVYERISEDSSYTPTPEEVAKLAGCYASPELGVSIDLASGENSSLRFTDPKGRALDFKALLPDLWRAGSNILEFERRGGAARGFYRSAELASRVWFERCACQAT